MSYFDNIYGNPLKAVMLIIIAYKKWKKRMIIKPRLVNFFKTPCYISS